MKELYLFFISMFFVANGYSQSPEIEWVKQLGSSAFDSATNITTDAEGNVFVIGAFQNSMDADPGSDEVTVESNGSSDVFLEKLDSNGDFLWIKQMGGTSSDHGKKISFDLDGNIFVIGRFNNTVDFDPGTEELNLSSAGKSDLFIQKLDSDGNFMWVKAIGGVESEFVNDLILDDDGNIYITGRFKETVDFDPNEGEETISSNGEIDVFIEKLDNDGNLLWVRTMGSEKIDIGNSLALDDEGNLLVAGIFREVMDFDPSEGEEILVPYGNEDIFLQKLDTDGNFMWVKQIGGPGANCTMSRILNDNNGDLILTGTFQQTVDLDPGPGLQYFSAEGLSNSFIQKLNSDGEFIWVKVLRGDHDISIRNVDIDANGNIYTTGDFRGTVDFDPGMDIQNQTSIGSSDIFIQNIDTNGNLHWYKTFGSLELELSYGITVEGNGNVFVAGNFQETVDFEQESLTSIGSSDMFILKIDNSTVSTTAVLENRFIVYPNPNQGLFVLDFDSEIHDVNISVYNVQGQKLFSNQYKKLKELNLNLNEPDGIYLLEIKTANYKKVMRLVVGK